MVTVYVLTNTDIQKWVSCDCDFDTKKGYGYGSKD